MIERDGMTTAEREAFAAEIRQEVDDGTVSIYASYEPGDMTHYDLVFVDMAVPLRLHGLSASNAARRLDTLRSTAPEIMELGLSAGHLVARDRWLMADGAAGFRAMTVDLERGHFTHPAYVAEKWRTPLGSAVVIAELLCMICESDQVERLRDSYPQVFDAMTASR